MLEGYTLGGPSLLLGNTYLLRLVVNLFLRLGIGPQQTMRLVNGSTINLFSAPSCERTTGRIESSSIFFFGLF